MVIALVLMGVASTLIGLMPTYATIGIAAPILLTILRFIQGLAIGGQWGGAMLLVTESAPADKRGYYGAYARREHLWGYTSELGVYIDQLISVRRIFQAWGWRIPFILSVILIGISMYIQLNVEDTDFQGVGSSSERALEEKRCGTLGQQISGARGYYQVSKTNNTSGGGISFSPSKFLYLD